jgi:phosphohistidine phosphatase
MKLYFLRHAEAADGMADAIRPLTKKGQDQSSAIGAYLADTGVKFDAAHTSPLVRAVETAEIVLAITNAKKDKLKLQQTDLLLNETSAHKFDGWLRALKDSEEVLLVGHNPSMTEHVARLLGVNVPATINLPKGALAVVKYLPPALAELKLFITPKGTGRRKE